MLRSVAAVAAGYLVFGLGTFVLFAATGGPPHEPASFPTLALVTACGVAFAFAGGYLAALVASQREALHGAALGGLIAVIALASLGLEWPRGAAWREVAAIVALACAALAGGLVRQRAVPFRAPSA
jgi:hypothetical protein